ncbi:MAG: EamA family transporter [Sulfurovum sp.]|nr:EamA family transporter [Sulfurovum sp.]
MGYFYIFGTIFFTVYGQIVLKWRINTVGSLPEELTDKIIFLFKLLFDPWIFSGFFAAFIASFFWMATMTKFDISYAYPFMSGAFVLVFLLSVFLFQETITWQKIIGLTFITLGIIITSRSI